MAKFVFSLTTTVRLNMLISLVANIPKHVSTLSLITTLSLDAGHSPQQVVVGVDTVAWCSGESATGDVLRVRLARESLVANTLRP